MTAMSVSSATTNTEFEHWSANSGAVFTIVLSASPGQLITLGAETLASGKIHANRPK